MPSLTERVAAIARGLGPARDAHALIDAVNKLERETEAGLGQGPIHSMRAWLEKRRHAAEQNLERSAASDAMRGLLEIKGAFAGLAVYPDNFRSLAKGTEASATARRAHRSRMRSAAERDEDLHELAQGRAASLAADAVARALLAVGADGPGRGRALDLAAARRRPRHLAAVPARLHPDHDLR